MAFADAYLDKHSSGKVHIERLPDPKLQTIVIIPAYNESGLLRCLDSLFKCHSPIHPVEINVLVNTPSNAPENIQSANDQVFTEVTTWMSANNSKFVHFHGYRLNDLPPKHFGAGLARKILMDEAVRRFNTIDRPEGIIVSLDADCTVSENYLLGIEQHFDMFKEASGCSIDFSHPRHGNEYPGEVYKAITNYENHLNYYLEAIRFTGYPYAFHTVGSAFAVRAASYCQVGGMSRRQAGEDFYFIQKLAMLGRFSECHTATVYPSPRPSDRVPFGTGPEIRKQLDSRSGQYMSYHPELFLHLSSFYKLIPSFYSEKKCEPLLIQLPGLIQQYLDETGFPETLDEIKTNVASSGSFSKRFYQKFNMFWILKYLHYAEEHGTERMEVNEAARKLKSLIDNK